MGWWGACSGVAALVSSRVFVAAGPWRLSSRPGGGPSPRTPLLGRRWRRWGSFARFRRNSHFSGFRAFWGFEQLLLGSNCSRGKWEQLLPNSNCSPVQLFRAAQQLLLKEQLFSGAKEQLHRSNCSEQLVRSPIGEQLLGTIAQFGNCREPLLRAIAPSNCSEQLFQALSNCSQSGHVALTFDF